MSDHHVVWSTVLSTLSSSFSAYFKINKHSVTKIEAADTVKISHSTSFRFEQYESRNPSQMPPPPLSADADTFLKFGTCTKNMDCDCFLF